MGRAEDDGADLDRRAVLDVLTTMGSLRQALVLGACVLAASDGRAEDEGQLRLFAGPTLVVVRSHEHTTTSPPSPAPATTATASEDASGNGFRAGLQQATVVTPQASGSWLFGYELAYTQAQWSTADERRRERSLTFDLIGGYAWRLGRATDLEWSSGVGGGIAEWSDWTVAGAEDDDAVAGELFTRLSLWSTVGRWFRYGGGIGLLASVSRPEFSATDATGTTTLRQATVWQLAPHALLGAGARF
jgi:hypothetical protein